MTQINEKACKSCRKVKPHDDFYENQYSPDGRYAFCKVCFDQFAQKLKEKEKASAPLNKTCKKCGKTRLIDAFDDYPDTPDGKDDWCNDCRQQHDNLKKQLAKKEQKQGPQAPKIKKVKPRDPTLKKSNAQKPVQEPEQKPTPEPVDDFDFIEYLLETQALEKNSALEKLKSPKQKTKIKLRKRICNGCGKTEEIDQVEKNTVIPAHAWFCDFCRQREAKRRVRKGITIQDYWGREFKVKKIINNHLVMGILKNKNGKWEKRPLKIYGNWETP
ncbi:MAG: hypothetical protein J7K96_03570 [Desulfobacteraceae bacterium]|nr:hypothetical protein [Desulfobacteraceae bacterium]